MTAASEYDSASARNSSSRPALETVPAHVRRPAGAALPGSPAAGLEHAQEADGLARHLRPLVESGTGLERTALAYLTAIKGWKRQGLRTTTGAV